MAIMFPQMGVFTDKPGVGRKGRYTQDLPVPPEVLPILQKAHGENIRRFTANPGPIRAQHTIVKIGVPVQEHQATLAVQVLPLLLQ